MAKPLKEHDLDPSKLPRHIAIIMDGNGRWARRRGLPRIAGHRAGLESVRAMVKTCRSLEIPFLTLYAFSSENWSRPKAEVRFLLRLLEIYLRKEVAELHANQVKLNVIGRIHELPASGQKELQRALEKTSKNKGLILTLALNYGGRNEIVDAAKHIAKEVKAGHLKPEDLNDEVFARYLYTASLPDPDLLIRSSGEFRLSNFLLWQASYSEIVISPTLWPDFRRPQLLEALKIYQKRERRFGDVVAH